MTSPALGQRRQARRCSPGIPLEKYSACSAPLNAAKRRSTSANACALPAQQTRSGAADSLPRTAPSMSLRCEDRVLRQAEIVVRGADRLRPVGAAFAGARSRPGRARRARIALLERTIPAHAWSPPRLRWSAACPDDPGAVDRASAPDSAWSADWSPRNTELAPAMKHKRLGLIGEREAAGAQPDERPGIRMRAVAMVRTSSSGSSAGTIRRAACPARVTSRLTGTLSGCGSSAASWLEQPVAHAAGLRPSR